MTVVSSLVADPWCWVGGVREQNHFAPVEVPDRDCDVLTTSLIESRRHLPVWLTRCHEASTDPPVPRADLVTELVDGQRSSR